MSDAFVPSTETVVASAQALAKILAPDSTWDDMPAYTRNWFTCRALDVLNGAGKLLVADSVNHVADRAQRFWLAGREPHLRHAADMIRGEVAADAR